MLNHTNSRESFDPPAQSCGRKLPIPATQPLVAPSTEDANERLKASEAATEMVQDMLQTVNAMLVQTLPKGSV